MSTECVIGIDVGGTAVKAALVDQDGAVLVPVNEPTDRAGGASGVVAQIVAIVSSLRQVATERDLTPVAVGVVVLGLVDDEAGTAVLSANLGWRDVPMRSVLRARIDLPLAFGHDVRAGGLAEAVLGSGRGVGDHLFLAIGTGVAGAVIVGGLPYPGSGYAGEIGHVMVEPEGRPCGCGSRGCLETVASAGAIARRYADRAGKQADAAEVAALASSDEPVAVAVWTEAVDALAVTLAGYVSLLAPERVVVGGGLAEAGEQLLGPLRARLAARLSFQRMPDVVAASLGSKAGCLGAGLLAWREAGLAKVVS